MDKVGFTAYAYTGKEPSFSAFIGVAQALAGRVPNLQITNSGVILRPRGFFETNSKSSENMLCGI